MIRHVLKRVWWVLLLPPLVPAFVVMTLLYYKLFVQLGFSDQAKGELSPASGMTLATTVLTVGWLALTIAAIYSAVKAYVPVGPVVESTPTKGDWQA